MTTAETFDTTFQEANQVRRGAPWQIWVVVTLLGLEGISNVFAIADHPIALWWLLAKILFITGLVKGWTWMFGVFIIVCIMHVVAFFATVPIASAINFLFIVLVYSARDHFFRGKSPRNSAI